MTNTERLCDLLSRKLALLEEILGYSKEQRELTYQDDSAKYDNLIESRAKCLEDLDKLEVVIKKCLIGLDESSVTDDAFREKLTGLNERINKTLQTIIELDQENKERILKEQAALKVKIQNIRKGRKGVAGYTANNRFSAAGIFTDNKG
ncbi:MAG: flagellar protein FlgN [Firmicutes bacterium]|nr:flagellar protein FlgN [Bacillota bacterium]